MSKHPDRALAHELKGAELRLLKGHYYLYEAHSKGGVKVNRGG
jgi:hypothetical protein